MRKTTATLLFPCLLLGLGACRKPAEKTASARPRGPRGPHLLRMLDANRDGVISAQEIAGAAAVLKKLDKNGDGKLTSDEVRPRRHPPRSGRHGQKLPQARSLAKNDQEKKILGVLAEMDRKRIGMMNISNQDGRLLRLLVEAIGAKHVVEIGTSNGNSGLWISLGLLATGGRLTTHEIDAHRARLARKHFKQAGVDSIITLVEGDAHKEVVKITQSIDLLFIDADKPGYIDYLQKLLPRVRPGGLIVAHNMVRPVPDPRYIKAITTDPKLDTMFLLMHGAGVGVTLKKR